MARAIFIEPPRADVDTSAAGRYGTVTNLYRPVSRGRGSHVEQPADPGLLKPRPSVTNLEAFADDVLEQLDRIRFDPRQDSLVLTGSTLALMLAFAAMCRRYGKFDVLVFDSVADDYVRKTFDIERVEAARV